MAPRFNLWTPLLFILSIQLIILFYLNLKTSAPTSSGLVSVHISASDRLGFGGNGGKNRAALLDIRSLVQIGAPASETRKSSNGDAAMSLSDEKNSKVEIDAPVDFVNNHAVINDVDKAREEEKRPPAHGGVDMQRFDMEEKRGDSLDGFARRNEVRRRADDEQFGSEREKAINARGDKKLNLQLKEPETVNINDGGDDGDGIKGKEMEGQRVVVGGNGDFEGQQHNRKNENENVPKLDDDDDVGRRKINQATMLKSRDSAKARGGHPEQEQQQRQKKSLINQKREQEVRAALMVEKRARINDAEGKKRDLAVKDGGNALNSKRRPLIEKVGQLKASRAHLSGRLRDMPFMQARRMFSEGDLLNNEGGGKIHPKFNYKKIEDIAKYADQLNYFDEFCKEVAEPLVECDERKPRQLTEDKAAGSNIMFTIRTTFDYHDSRLPILFETWLSTVDPRTVFLVTDGEDRELDDITENIGMHYINAQSGTSHARNDLCCKAGVELELMFYQQNEAFDWLCHIDDDIYVNLNTLTRTLAKFDPRNESIYFGRSGSPYLTPRTVKPNSKLGKAGQPYHFAVGGMYCLSRRMLQLAKDYLVGCETFSSSCQKTEEPEDVTVGLVVGVVLNQQLSRTEMIYTHGVDLMSFVPSPYIDQQIAFAYGYGSVESWHFTPNIVYVPGALFNPDEDSTQFKSIHCHLFPSLPWCLDKKRQVAAILEELKNRSPGEKHKCVCTWKTVMCCEVWKEAYRKSAEHVMKERLKEKELQQQQGKDGVVVPGEARVAVVRANRPPKEPVKSVVIHN